MFIYKHYFDDVVSDQIVVNFDYTRVLDPKWSLRLFGNFIRSIGGVNLFDASTGWTNFSFHKKDEMRLVFGTGVTRNFNDLWSLSVNVAHLFDGRNTDASDSSLAITLAKRF